MRTPTLPAWTHARKRCQQKGCVCTVVREVQGERLTWKAPDERLLAVECVDAAGFLVKLAYVVFAIEHPYKFNDSLQKLTAGAPRGTENHNLAAHGKSETGGENCDTAHNKRAKSVYDYCNGY